MKTLLLVAAATAFAAPALAQNPVAQTQPRPAEPGAVGAQGVTPPGVMAAPNRTLENSAAASNAEQQAKPVPNTGNVSGGPRTAQ